MNFRKITKIHDFRWFGDVQTLYEECTPGSGVYVSRSYSGGPGDRVRGRGGPWGRPRRPAGQGESGGALGTVGTRPGGPGWPIAPNFAI